MASPPPPLPYELLKAAMDTYQEAKWEPFFALFPHKTVTGKWIWMTKAFTKITLDRESLTWETDRVYTTYEEGPLEVLGGN